MASNRAPAACAAIAITPAPPYAPDEPRRTAPPSGVIWGCRRAPPARSPTRRAACTVAPRASNRSRLALGRRVCRPGARSSQDYGCDGCVTSEAYRRGSVCVVSSPSLTGYNRDGERPCATGGTTQLCGSRTACRSLAGRRSPSMRASRRWCRCSMTTASIPRAAVAGTA